MQLQGREFKEGKLVPDGPEIECLPARLPFLFGTGMAMVTGKRENGFAVYEQKCGLMVNGSKAATRSEAIALAEAYLKKKTLPVVVARYKEVSKML